MVRSTEAWSGIEPCMDGWVYDMHQLGFGFWRSGARSLSLKVVEAGYDGAISVGGM